MVGLFQRFWALRSLTTGFLKPFADVRPALMRRGAGLNRRAQ